MKHSNLFKLLLTTTLLTACGDSQTDAERKAEQGITSDGTAGEVPTIEGNQADSRISTSTSTSTPTGEDGGADPTATAADGTDGLPDNFVGQFLKEPEAAATLSKLQTAALDIASDAKTFAASHPEAKIANTPENVAELTAFMEKNLKINKHLLHLTNGILERAISEYKKFNVKGDLRVVENPSAPWATLRQVQENITLFENPTAILETLKPKDEELAQAFSTLGEKISKEIETATEAALKAKAKQLEEELAALEERNQKLHAELQKLTHPTPVWADDWGDDDDEEPAAVDEPENLRLLQIALDTAVSARVSKLFYVGDTYTLHAQGLTRMNSIASTMAQKGFLNTSSVNANYTPHLIEDATSIAFPDHLVKSHLSRDINKTIRFALKFNSDSSERYEDALSLPYFAISTDVLKKLNITPPADITGQWIIILERGFSQYSWSQPRQQQHSDSDAFHLEPSSDTKGKASEADVKSIAKEAYKAFVSALIPMPEFKGLFDFLKEVDGFKDDAEFMALFNPSATGLSSGAISTLSSGLGLAARTRSTGLDASAFSLNGTHGGVTHLNLPIHLNLTGALSTANTTDNLSATASYHVNTATSVAVQHAYANSGKGFGVNSYQNETSAIVNHAFNNMLFVEAGLGYVGANNVHNSLWSGMQTYAKLGVDIAEGILSPFVQVTHKHLNQDTEFTLNHTGYTVGVNSTIANLTTHAYTLNATVGASATYVNHHWATPTAAIGNTQFIETELSANLNLNLNSGVSVNSYLGVTPNNTSVGFNVNLNY